MLDGGRGLLERADGPIHRAGHEEFFEGGDSGLQVAIFAG